MLKKLNELYSKIVYESTEDPWYRKITKDNEFFNYYLNPLAKEYKVNIVKARLNTFRICGLYKNVIDALNNFKVDETYWNKEVFGRDFVVFSPMITFGEVIHIMNFDEGYPRNTVEANSLYAQQNFQRFHMEGRWYEPKELDKNNQFDYPIRAKFATPSDLAIMIDQTYEESGICIDKDNLIVCVEFVLNCENLANQVYDEQTQFIPITQTIDEDEKQVTLSDKINNTEAKDVTPTAKCELPKENTENNVKVPEVNKTNNNINFKTPVINSYDAKNKFKKITKEVK